MRWILPAMLLSTAAHTALAQDASAPSAATSEAGTISYPASFFTPMELSTAYDMVRRVPGFTFDGGNSARGFASAAGNVLIDGERPASKTDDLATILSRLPASQVERIDLIRGGAPGIDMQGKAVVADIIRRQGQGFAGVAVVGQYFGAEGYTDPQTQLEGAWRGNGHTLEASVRSFKGHDNSWGSGPHTIRAANGALLDFSRMHNSEPNSAYRASGAYEAPIFGGRFRGTLTLVNAPLEIRSFDDFQVAGSQGETLQQSERDGELGLHYSRDLSTRLGLELLGLQHLSETSVDSVFQTSTETQHFHLADRAGESIVRGIAHWRPLNLLNIDTGGEFAYNWLDAATSLEDNGLAITLPAANVHVQEARSEAFATAVWRVSSPLSIEAGLRLEDSAISSTGDVTLSNRFTFAKPHLLLTWSPTGSDQMRLRVEHEVGQLDFSAFTANAALNGSGVSAGNPNLSPQQDWLAELAFEHRFWRDGVVSLTYRRLEITDAIDRAPIFSTSGVFDEPANIGNGVENDVVLSFNLPLARLGLQGASVRGAATWRSSVVTDPTTHRSRRISGQHPLDAELHFNQDLPRWRINWGANVAFGYRERLYLFDEIDTNQTSDGIDVFAEYRPRPDLVFRVQLFARSRYDATRDVFLGPRSTDPLQFVDFQDRRFGPTLFLRLRKTLD